jgi:hypothetical protein
VNMLCRLGAGSALEALCARGAGFTAGGSHVPSRIEGGVSFGQYKRNIGMNFAFGAGSQLASLSLPGESACRYRSTEPASIAEPELPGGTSSAPTARPIPAWGEAPCRGKIKGTRAESPLYLAAANPRDTFAVVLP